VSRLVGCVLAQNHLGTANHVPSLVFVHGYGGTPETTWHDESTGKIWIKDEEFITRIRRPIRIFSFSYNGDVDSNLSSSSPAFHASDLLCCLEQALDRSTVRLLMPLIWTYFSYSELLGKAADIPCPRLWGHYCEKGQFQTIRRSAAVCVFS
jgi:hypothetical protein